MVLSGAKNGFSIAKQSQIIPECKYLYIFPSGITIKSALFKSFLYSLLFKYRLIILISHKKDLIEEFCDEVIFIEKGKIIN